MFSDKMFQISFTTYLIILIFFFLLAFLVVLFYDFLNKKWKNKEKSTLDTLPQPPSPRKLPIIGHLHLLGGYEVPYQAFTNLGKKYGDVFRLQLGNVKCVVVNEQKNIREALVTKGHHFDSRPNFQRYQQLFCGNKENSLAFCNWSSTQKIRRDMLKGHTFPRAFTNNFFSLETLIITETESMMSRIIPNEDTALKPLILQHCANIFLNHFCSKSFKPSNKKFVEMVENFDDIFYEVNQGYAADFLPFLLPLLKKNLKKTNELTHNIRSFIINEVIGDRFDNYDVDFEPADYVESLMKHVKGKESPELSWDSALFALEDILGGHSAIGNFLVKLFAYLVKEPEVQERIQKEIEDVVGKSRQLTIGDRNNMPYTEAAIFEAIRLIASPIVPRVANQDSSINEFRIEKDTVIFLNNYDLSMSEDLWDEPEKFKPERFLKENRLVKPEYFLPFGGGRRSCMGYKMVQLVSFGILGMILQNFRIAPASKETYKVPVGSLALTKDTFKFRFIKR